MITDKVTAPRIDKLPNRPTNPWAVKVTVGGKKKSRSFPTKAAALAHLSRLNTARTNGDLFDTGTGLPVTMGTTTGPTVAEAATELLAAKWALLRGPSRTGLVDGLAHVIAATHGSSVDRHTSYTAAYRSLSRAELSPAQLDVWRKMTQTSARVTALDKQTVTDLVAVLASNLDGTPASGSGLSRRRSAITQVLAYGCDKAGTVPPPLPKKQRGTRQVKQARVSPSRIGTVTEAATVTDAARGEVARVFWLMLLAGLRPAEATALRWENVDLAAGVLVIAESAPHSGAAFSDSGNAFDVQPPKWRVDGAARVVPIVPRLAGLLAGWGPGDGLVARTERGTKFSASAVGAKWKTARAVAAAGWPDAKLCVPYDLRHTHISVCLSAGVPVRELAERCGHSASQLLDTYADVVVADGPRWTSVMGDALG